MAIRLALMEVKLDAASRMVTAHENIIRELRELGMETEIAESSLAESQTVEKRRRGERDRLVVEYRALH